MSRLDVKKILEIKPLDKCSDFVYILDSYIDELADFYP